MAKILVVDDNAVNRKLVVALLEYEGHSVIEAGDGAEGLQLARSHRPELVISDILMPAMDGYEFVRQLRADPQLALTEVIFYTAHYHDTEARQLAQTCQVKYILAKPSEATQLLETVAQALESTRAGPSSGVAEEFDQHHLRLLTNKLAQKVAELQREVEQRTVAEEGVRKLNRVHAVLSGINSLIVRVRTRDELCTEACRIAVEHGRFKVAWIGLHDRVKDVIQPAAWGGESHDLWPNDGIALSGSIEGPGMVRAAMQLRLPVVCNDFNAPTHPVRQRDEMLVRGYRSAVVLPLLIGHRAVGCIALISDEKDFFDEAEMKLLLELAGDVAFALDHIEKAEKMHHLSFYDALTGLANRELFTERLDQHVAEAGRSGHGFAVVVADLERFETINDSLGRHVGDQVLRLAAERFACCSPDRKDIARVGSDQFATVIAGLSGEREVARAVQDWGQRWLSAPFSIDGIELAISAKAGIAVFPDDGPKAEILLRNAESALKQAKEKGERQAFYTEPAVGNRAEWLTFENNLRRALENEEFVLHYQPKVDLEDRKLKGVEALIRWQSPALGLVPPNLFIGLLEETGMIAEVGAWALRQASMDRSRWLEQGLPAPRVAVNVSTVQLRHQDFVRTVTKVLRLAGADPGLDIEVTESLIMEDVAANIEKLRQIRDLGIGIAIDDFGTGYSSLGYLAKIPAESLKIDRSFVHAMLDDPGAMTLVSTMIQLAHALKLQVIAEGVELEEQAKILRLLRCDQMQGYLISRPLAFDVLTTYLARTRS